MKNFEIQTQKRIDRTLRFILNRCMIVCICNHVNDGKVKEVLEEGCQGVDQVCHKLGMEFKCGKCESALHHLTQKSVMDTAAMESRSIMEGFPEA